MTKGRGVAEVTKGIIMDPEEERVLYLTRVGREKIFKYGTYVMVKNRAITQDHPFYVKREDIEEDDISPAALSEPAPVMEEVDPEVLAAQVMASNFKVGLTQEEVDALLGGLA